MIWAHERGPIERIVPVKAPAERSKGENRGWRSSVSFWQVGYRCQQNTNSIGQRAEKAKEVQNIAHGVFSPLEGFLNKDDFLSVLEEGRLKNGLPWTIPIVLDASSPIIIGRADEAIRRRAASELELHGMGSTLVAALVTPGECLHLHAGDSRLYRFRRDCLPYVTSDHSVVRVMLETGQIEAEEVATHPMRAIVTSSLGGLETWDSAWIQDGTLTVKRNPPSYPLSRRT